MFVPFGDMVCLAILFVGVLGLVSARHCRRPVMVWSGERTIGVVVHDTPGVRRHVKHSHDELGDLPGWTLTPPAIGGAVTGWPDELPQFYPSGWNPPEEY